MGSRRIVWCFELMRRLGRGQLIAIVAACVALSTVVSMVNHGHQTPPAGTTWASLDESVAAIPAVADREGTGQGRARYEQMRLMNPALGRIPDSIRAKEIAFARSLAARERHESKRFSAVEPIVWEARGPYNIGGRVRGLAVDVTDHRRVVAGGVTGGIWISEDWGENWAKTGGNDVSLDVSCLVQDTRQGRRDVWYYGTGELYGSGSGGANNEYSSYHYHGAGVFKSTDRGVSWRQLESTASHLSDFATPFDVVNNLAVNPANYTDDEILAATFRTIHRSIDGGETWQLVLGEFDGHHASLSSRELNSYTNVAVTSDGIMYASIGSGNADAGFWRSENGVDWQDISPPDMPLNVQRTVFAIAPSNERKVYVVSVTPGWGFTSSVDGGLSMWSFIDNGGDIEWTNLSDNFPDFSAAATNTYWGAAYATQNGYDMAAAVHPDDEDIVYLAGLSLFRSTNGFRDTTETEWIGGFSAGNQFSQSIADDRLNYLNHHGDLHNLVFDPVDSNVLFTASDGGVHKTLNSLAPAPLGSVFPWIAHEGMVTSQFYSVAVDPVNPGRSSIMGGMQDNSTYLSTGSEYSLPWRRMSGGDGMACAIGANPVEGWTSYYTSMQFGGFFAHIVLDDDANMVRWNYLNPPGNYTLWLAPFKLDPADWRTMYIAGDANIWRNVGEPERPDWEAVPNLNLGSSGGLISALDVSHDGQHTLYLAQSFPFSRVAPRVYRISNALSVSPEIDDVSSIDFNRGSFIHCLSVDPMNPDHVIAVFTNYGVRSLYATDDGGLSWRSIGGNLEEFPDGTGRGPAMFWAEILRDGPQRMYLVGTSIGLYSTTDISGDAITWVQEGVDTIGHQRVMGMDVRDSENFVGVATHGGGTYSASVVFETAEEQRFVD